MIETLAALGVTRLSLGGQSFRTEKLRLLERDHDAAANRARPSACAKRAGMHVSLDLIFATPGETLDQWSADLDAALALAPRPRFDVRPHVRARHGILEPPLARRACAKSTRSLERDMYALAIDRLTAAGFEHYEVSNFARPGCRSRHNETYWSGDGYFAAGPGAARYVDGVRETNHRSTTTYLQRVLAGESPVAEREELSPEARARELLVFGLRRIDGVSRREFRGANRLRRRRAGRTAPLQKFVALGLLADRRRSNSTHVAKACLSAMRCGRRCCRTNV